jgi:hypothetical protein
MRASLLFVASGVTMLGAQQRRTLDDRDPQAQLMGYYAATMQFGAIGLPDRAGRLELGGAVTLIPTLSLADRTVGFGGTKPEDSNLCPVYPRLTASKGFGALSAEAGWTPPVTVCGVTANVLSAALGYRFKLGASWDGHVRLSGLTGHLDASITCSDADTAAAANLTCYLGSPSSDRVAPLALAADFGAAWQGWRARRIEPYVSVGVRYERIDFDVNYTRTAAQASSVLPLVVPPLDDHERLRATLSRLQLAAGVLWGVTRRLKLGGELYYAPGAMMTGRGRASFAIGRGE